MPERGEPLRLTVEPRRHEVGLLARIDNIAERLTGLPTHSIAQIVRSPTRMRNGLSKRIARKIIPILVSTHSVQGLELVPVGAGEGRWLVPAAALRKDGVAYCVGVGYNVSLDFSLAKDFGCRVYSFDPTPASIGYMEQLAYDEAEVTFVPVGVWEDDTMLTFFAPNEHEVNYSAVDVHGTGQTVTAPVKRLRTLMREFAHVELDLLKLDVEGAWGAIIGDMISSDVLPRVLLVEFDSPTSAGKIRRTNTALEAAGLRLVHFAREDFVYVRQDVLRELAQ